MVLIAWLHTLCSILLALHGALVLLLVAIYVRGRIVCGPVRSAGPDEPSDFPVVTVQVPLYNERYVAERCIDSVAALDWPRDRLQVQILDDSTDDTTAIARARVECHRRQGLDIALIHRPHRAGYKAGALATGLAQARGEYVTLFDADFVPAPDFIRKMLPHFAGDPAIGYVQARWGHVAPPRSALARAWSLVVDGHFVVEQFARQCAGWPMAFNGSAGMWRATCIRSSGGWQDDTLCEDLDISYRAALRGWRCVYVPEVSVLQEEPSTLLALKAQQARWAKGGAQCLRKHARAILASPRWSIAQKAMGLSSLAAFSTHLLLVALVLTWLPLALADRTPSIVLGLCGLGLPAEFALAQWALHRRDGRWLRRLLDFPALLLVGFGIALSNAQAVLGGLFTRGGEFSRTPKYSPGEAVAEGYRSHDRPGSWLEIGMALYALAAAVALWRAGDASTATFLLVCGAGFGTVGLVSWIEAARRTGRSPGTVVGIALRTWSVGSGWIHRRANKRDPVS